MHHTLPFQVILPLLPPPPPPTARLVNNQRLLLLFWYSSTRLGDFFHSTSAAPSFLLSFSSSRKGKQPPSPQFPLVSPASSRPFFSSSSIAIHSTHAFGMFSKKGRSAAATDAGTKRRTYFISDERMLLHANLWDDSFPEKPLRLKSILDAVGQERLLERCEHLESRRATEEELLLAHSKKLVEEVKATENYSEKELAHYTANHEYVYVNPHTWESALLAAGCALKATESVLSAGPGANAFAAIRPPGHHASRDKVAGFCFFNNVAICAKRAVELGVERVLIVDWDVHQGNGTQAVIADNVDAIRLVSIHLYEHGACYPKLPAGATIHPFPNSINVPLNQAGYSDADYAAFMHLLVLPLIEEWRPQLLLVSCGFDAAMGDPLGGGMALTPLGYGYMTGVLAATSIPMVVLLEGGYFIESVAQGAVFALRALIERRPPKRPEVVLDLSPSPHPSFLHTLYTVMQHYSPLCSLYVKWLAAVNTLRASHNLPALEAVADRGEYHQQSAKELYPLKLVGLFPSQKPDVAATFHQRVEAIVRAFNEAASAVEGKEQDDSEGVRLFYKIGVAEKEGGDKEVAKKLVVIEIDAHRIEVELGGNGEGDEYIHHSSIITLMKLPLGFLTFAGYNCLDNNGGVAPLLSATIATTTPTATTAAAANKENAMAVKALEQMIAGVKQVRELILFP